VGTPLPPQGPHRPVTAQDGVQFGGTSWPWRIRRTGRTSPPPWSVDDEATMGSLIDAGGRDHHQVRRPAAPRHGSQGPALPAAYAASW